MSDEYDKGFSDKKSVWMSSNELGSEVLLSLGRAGNGGRFDSEFEIPYKILLMKKVIMRMLVDDFILSKVVPTTDAATHETILARSIRVRLGSKQIKAAMRARTIIFYCCIAPLRMLMNSKELRQGGGNHEPLRLYDFGKVLDILKKVLTEAKESPASVLQIDFKFFSLGEFPCLFNFYANRNNRLLCKQAGESFREAPCLC